MSLAAKIVGHKEVDGVSQPDGNHWRGEVLKRSLRRAEVMSRDKFYRSTTKRLSSFDEMRDKKITKLRGQFAGSFIDVDVAITK